MSVKTAANPHHVLEAKNKLAYFLIEKFVKLTEIEDGKFSCAL